jgi:hypothetical protein
VQAGPTTLVNVTGAVLLEIVPPGSNGRADGPIAPQAPAG